MLYLQVHTLLQENRCAATEGKYPPMPAAPAYPPMLRKT